MRLLTFTPNRGSYSNSRRVPGWAAGPGRSGRGQGLGGHWAPNARSPLLAAHALHPCKVTGLLDAGSYKPRQIKQALADLHRLLLRRWLRPSRRRCCGPPCRAAALRAALWQRHHAFLRLVPVNVALQRLQRRQHLHMGRGREGEEGLGRSGRRGPASSAAADRPHRRCHSSKHKSSGSRGGGSSSTA